MVLAQSLDNSNGQSVAHSIGICHEFSLSTGVLWGMLIDPIDSSAYGVLSQIVSALVDQAEAVRIIPAPQPEGVSFSITVDGQDTGKLIGKQGRTAKALRIILSAVGMKTRRRYTVDIAQQARESSPVW